MTLHDATSLDRYYSQRNMLWLATIPLLPGVLLLILGWCGRRIDHHPLCRGCGYDLVGSEMAVCCPECGRDLWQPGARRIGHRRRRRGMLAFGALLVLVSAGVGGTLGWAAARGFDFTPYKPLWLLKREAVLPSGPANARRASVAEREILRRLNAGALSQRQVDAIVNEALIAQADPNAAWFEWWGDVIEQGWFSGVVSDEKVLQYARTAAEATLALEVTPKVRRGAPMWVYITSRSIRAGRSGALMQETTRGAITLDGGRALSRGSGISQGVLRSGGYSRGGSGFTVDLPAGKHTVSTKVQVKVGPTHSALNRRGLDPSAKDPSDPDWPMATWTLALKADFEVVPEDVEIVERVADPSLAEAIGAAITVRRCRAFAISDQRVLLDCHIEMTRPPMDVAFEVFLRGRPGPHSTHHDDGDAAATSDDRQEWPVQSRAAQASQDFMLGRHVPNLGDRPVLPFPRDVQRVDVVLRSSTRVAEQVGFFRIWDGEIVIEDVPVEWVDSRSPTAGSP